MEDAMRDTGLFIPALKPLYDRLGRFSYPFIRFVVGLAMMPHGWAKFTVPKTQQGVTALMGKLGFHPAAVFFWFIAGLELFGGAMLALGLLTRLIALMLTVELIVIIFDVFIPNGRAIDGVLMWAFVIFAFAWGGGGRYSLDRLIGREV
ncbi:MAG TPA: DoxX family protein [Stellaceae bacterium]|nr:DoxX family protein [Stellaceae bacterium]